MKKIRVMLLSFILLAIVGGTLAFKTKLRIGYCTTDPNISPSAGFCTFDASTNKTCPVDLAAATTILPAEPVSLGYFCYTTPQNLDGNPGVECEFQGNANQCISTTRQFWEG